MSALSAPVSKMYSDSLSNDSSCSNPLTAIEGGSSGLVSLSESYVSYLQIS